MGRSDVPGNVLALVRHAPDRVRNSVASFCEVPVQLAQVNVLDERVVAFRYHAQSHHHGHERGLGEAVRVEYHHAPGFAEQFDLMVQRIRNRHVGAVAPEFGVVASGQLVMHDDEVAHRFVSNGHVAVEFVDQLGAAVALREQRNELAHGRLDQVDAGRFERLDEAGRQADRHTILDPRFAPAPGHEAQLARLSQRRRIKRIDQHLARLVVAGKRIAVHVAVAGAVLQRDAPDPAGALGAGAGVGCHLRELRAGHGERAVARQLLAPVNIARVHCVFDQQGAKARAVDEQIAFDTAAVAQLERGNEPGLGMLLHRHDRAFDALRSARHGIVAQVVCIQAGVEVKAVRVGVGDRWHVGAGRREFVLARHHRRHRPVLQRRHVVEGLGQPQPMHVRRAVFDRRAEVAEAVKEAVAHLAPVFKFDAELETGLRLFDEIGAVQAERGVVETDRRKGGFADPDGADLGRLHQDHLAALAKTLGQGCCAHPAGGAAADDDDLANGIFKHVVTCRYVVVPLCRYVVVIADSKV